MGRSIPQALSPRVALCGALRAPGGAHDARRWHVLLLAGALLVACPAPGSTPSSAAEGSQGFGGGANPPAATTPTGAANVRVAVEPAEGSGVTWDRSGLEALLRATLETESPATRARARGMHLRLDADRRMHLTLLASLDGDDVPPRPIETEVQVPANGDPGPMVQRALRSLLLALAPDAQVIDALASAEPELRAQAVREVGERSLTAQLQVVAGLLNPGQDAEVLLACVGTLTRLDARAHYPRMLGVLPVRDEAFLDAALPALALARGDDVPEFLTGLAAGHPSARVRHAAAATLAARQVAGSGGP